MRCVVLAILMLATTMSANAQSGADPCQDTYVIRLKDGSEVEATSVKTDSSYHRATVRMRGALVPRAIPSDQVERVSVRMQPDTGPSVGRIIAEPLAGLGVGTVAAIAVFAAVEGAGIPSTSQDGDSDDLTKRDVLAIGLVLTSYVVGNAYGVYLVGDAGRETGSFWTTLLGSAIIFVAFGVGGYLGPAFLGAPIGATVAFNMTRRSKCPDAQNAAALFDVDRENGRFAFGAPRVSSRVSPIDGTTMQTVDVLRVRF